MHDADRDRPVPSGAGSRYKYQDCDAGYRQKEPGCFGNRCIHYFKHTILTRWPPGQFGREPYSRVLPPRNPELQRVQHVITNRFRRLMIAVVKQDNVARSYIFQSPPHRGRGLQLPVMSIDGPHYDPVEPRCPRRREKLWAPKAVRRADTGGAISRSPKDRLVTAP